jgi:hypothetical protein
MSYFFCGFKNNSDNKTGIKNIFNEILPKQNIDNSIQFNSKSSYFMSFGNNRIIPDLAINNKKTGSWFVATGTPLFKFDIEEESLLFLDDFFDNPVKVLNNKIDGNISILSYDAVNDRLIVATDLNNSIPVFYTNTPDGIFFSSNELVLAKYFNSEIDPFGFNQVIHLGVVWGKYTRFKNINKMLPGQFLIVKNNKDIQDDFYWLPKKEKIWKGSFNNIINRWISILRKSVLKYYEYSGKKTVVADLTAGEDSRLIVAQCHEAGIPFKAYVHGYNYDDLDIVIAKKAAKTAGFDITAILKKTISEEQLFPNVLEIVMKNEGYLEFFNSCVEFSNISKDIDDYKIVKYCGVPGGEAFRGNNYLRGKVLFPTLMKNLDGKFFSKMTFLLDFYPGLMKFSDIRFLDSIDKLISSSLKEVNNFPVGIQMDHLLRLYGTCLLGMKYRNPLYLPLATMDITRSIYNLSPKFKKAGKLTKACTEILFPKLAFVKNQNGVPTIKRTFWRWPYFIPEKISIIKKIVNGILGRLNKLRQAKKWYFNNNASSFLYKKLFNQSPYSDWFSSANKMISGHLYNPDILNSLLTQAKKGEGKYSSNTNLGRIISQEIVCRWVYNNKHSIITNKD